MNIKYAAVLAPQEIYGVCYGTVEGQRTLKTKVNIFGFLKTFYSIEGIYRYSLAY